MCGITGFFQYQERSNEDQLREIGQKMAETLLHRGPDSGAVWADENTQIVLGHRRLSIIDLSPEGNQPMVSASGRFVLVLNGEIYNFLDLRKELLEKGHSFRGHSDTEIALAGFEEWGFLAATKKFVGMFAMALWDREARNLILIRDRIGEKPLFYAWMQGAFLFGSELKALKKHPRWRGTIDRNALCLFLRHSYIPAPFSIFEGVYKLKAGHFMQVSLDKPQEHRPEPYWQAYQAAMTGLENPFNGTEDEATSRLDSLLRVSVKRQMISDVPLGAFLSGGVDSSTIVSLMQAQSPRPVKTFTIGFHEMGFNEAEHAKLVAQHLGTDHTELYVTPSEALGVIPKLPNLYDEPFADCSQIPTFLVAQLARRHVTVSLSGDAGDELFGGYTRYFWAQRIWSYIELLPWVLREKLSKILLSIHPRKFNHLARKLEFMLPPKLRQSLWGEKLGKLGETLNVRTPAEMYWMLISQWKDPEKLVIGGKEPITTITDPACTPPLNDFVQEMMFLDLLTYLSDDILVKVDRACMGVSLESRIPLLDHNVVEFAMTLPIRMKVRDGKGKWILRKVLDRYVPRDLIERPKMGFGVPIDSWLRGSLRPWAEDLLSGSRLRSEGFFNPELIQEKWQEHVAGKRNWQYYLWGILMFQSWLEENSGYGM